MANTNTSSLRRMIYAALFGALTAIGAFMVIPLQPVPITLQTLCMGLSGLLLGSRTGALSQVIYVLLGIIGMPVFAGGKSGLGTLLGPSGGYIIGFIAAAYIIGRLTEDQDNLSRFRIGIALAAGNLVVYTLGTLQLAWVAKLSLIPALLAGVVPFLPGELLKMAAAIWLTPKLRNNFRL